MSDAENALIALIDENIEKLNRLRKAPELDGQINKIEFSISTCDITIKDEYTLDVEVAVTMWRKEMEYASMFDYWVDVKPRLLKSTDNGLKSKEAYEFLYALQVYDGTTKPNGNSSPSRALVQAALEELINVYTGEPTQKPAFYRFGERDSKAILGCENYKYNCSMFLIMNKNALHSLLFSQKQTIDEIDSKSAELAKGAVYRKTLRGIADSIKYMVTPKNAIEDE